MPKEPHNCWCRCCHHLDYFVASGATLCRCAHFLYNFSPGRCIHAKRKPLQIYSTHSYVKYMCANVCVRMRIFRSHLWNNTVRRTAKTTTTTTTTTTKKKKIQFQSFQCRLSNVTCNVLTIWITYLAPVWQWHTHTSTLCMRAMQWFLKYAATTSIVPIDNALSFALAYRFFRTFNRILLYRSTQRLKSKTKQFQRCF